MCVGLGIVGNNSAHEGVWGPILEALGRGGARDRTPGIVKDYPILLCFYIYIAPNPSTQLHIIFMDSLMLKSVSSSQFAKKKIL